MTTTWTRTALLLFALLSVAACGSKSKAAPADPEPDVDTAAASWTLVEVTQGDQACYITVRDADGTDVTHPGTFDLCTPENEAMVGSRVTLTIEKLDMMAESCGGDPECPDTEEADVVTVITAAP